MFYLRAECSGAKAIEYALVAYMTAVRYVIIKLREIEIREYNFRAPQNKLSRDTKSAALLHL